MQLRVKDLIRLKSFGKPRLQAFLSNHSGPSLSGFRPKNAHSQLKPPTFSGRLFPTLFSHTPTFRRTSGVRHHFADNEAPALPGKSLTVRFYLCARGGTPEEDSFSLSPSGVRTPSLTGIPVAPFVVALVGSPLRRRTSPHLPSRESRRDPSRLPPRSTSLLLRTHSQS